MPWRLICSNPIATSEICIPSTFFCKLPHLTCCGVCLCVCLCVCDLRCICWCTVHGWISLLVLLYCSSFFFFLYSAPSSGKTRGSRLLSTSLLLWWWLQWGECGNWSETPGVWYTVTASLRMWWGKPSLCSVLCQQIRLWSNNPDQFVEDEDEDSFSYSVRISAQDLLLVSNYLSSFNYYVDNDNGYLFSKYLCLSI